jgi:hypothetical protein
MSIPYLLFLFSRALGKGKSLGECALARIPQVATHKYESPRCRRHRSFHHDVPENNSRPQASAIPIRYVRLDVSMHVYQRNLRTHFSVIPPQVRAQGLSWVINSLSPTVTNPPPFISASTPFVQFGVPPVISGLTVVILSAWGRVLARMHLRAFGFVHIHPDV